MAVQKFSQITQSAVNMTAADFMMIVQNGTTDLLYTPAQVTAGLNIFTAALRGLVPASGGGTTNFLRADGSFAAPPTNAPGGAAGTVQWNNSSVFAGITNVTTNGTNLTGIRIASTNSLDWDSGAASADLSLFRDAANTLAQRNSTNAQALRVYNTFTDAANYERGVFDWTTTPGTLTIGMQFAGTGTAKPINIPYGSTGVSFSISGLAALWLEQANSRLSLYTSWSVSWGTAAAGVGVDTGLSRVGPSVVGIGAGSGGNTGWFQWGGQTRVSGSDFSKTNDTGLANVTGLSVNVAAARTYSFIAYLSWTDAAAGGVQAAIGGTCTAGAIRYDGWIIDSAANGIKGNAASAALGGAVASATTTGTNGVIQIEGTITVGNAGTLTVQFAQNTSNGTSSTVKIGSYFIVNDMP